MANAQLIISQPGRRMRRVEVSAGFVSIGRRADNTLSLEGDTNVSKYHAVIEERGGGYWLADLGSSNGTQVNNEPLRGERKLSDGDLISIGGTSTIEFRLAKTDGDGAAGPDAAAGAGGPDAGAGGAGTTNSGLSIAQGAQSGASAGLSAASSGLSSVSSAASSLGSFSPTASASSAASSAMAPANSALSSASSAMSSVTSTASTASSAAAAPAANASSMLAPRLIIGGVAGVTVIGVVLAILFGTGAIGNKKTAATKDDPASIDELLAQPEPTASSADAAKKDSAANADSSTSAASSSAPAAADASSATAPVAPASSSGDVSPQEIAGMANLLATQITQRSGYTFDQNFTLRIKQHIDEYRTAAGYYERAHKYQGAVEREFANNKGIAPLFAYLLAMSRTRFIEKDGGVWQLPAPVAKYYAPDMTTADLNDPDKSARVAATYTKQLLDTFPDRDNFMYVVACYGMPINEAGNVVAALQAKDPGGDQRFDFWKMKNAGVVGGDQIDNVARFFAAGIVCEHPQQFGLRQEKPLSSLQ
jgi:predicted component of type VI protein secretion system